MLEILAGWHAVHSPMQQPPGVIHCFSGTIETAEKYLRMGFYLSLGAYIGYPSSKALRDVIKQLPLDRLMLETDSPFLPPQSKRGQRNEPSYVVEAAGELSAIKGLPLEVIAGVTTDNTKRLFGING
jgi:TatD DNase family protein